MPTPSLILVPARFKTGKLYTPVATTSGGVVLGASGDFNVTRATTATRVNASGYIESVASGIPRLDYYTSGGTAGCPALLVEPSGSNTLSGSVSIDTGWTITADTTITSGIVSPSGSTNATLFQATNTASRVRQAATLVSGTTYTFSCFGKFGSLSSGFTMNVFDENAASYGSGVCQAFNLNEGTLGASGTIGAGFTLQSVGMENYGNDWYRCRMTVLMSYTPTTPRVGFRMGTQITGGRPLSVANGTVNVWGAQLETGSVATSYIPTTTGSVSRNADVITLSGAVSGCIGQTEGTIYAEVDVRNFPSPSRLIGLSDGTSNNRIIIIFNTSNRIRLLATVSTASQVDINSSSQVAGIFKIAVGYALNDYAFYINGVQVGTDTIALVPACSSIFLGNAETGLAGSNINDRIRAAALYTTRLTNDQLAALTTP